MPLDVKTAFSRLFVQLYLDVYPRFPISLPNGLKWIDPSKQSSLMGVRSESRLSERGMTLFRGQIGGDASIMKEEIIENLVFKVLHVFDWGKQCA
jgi:hypothetical protein